MNIEEIPLINIQPYKNNAKLHPDSQVDQIIASIRMFGNNDPIAIDENNTIIEGHGRFLALKKMGKETADCIRLSHMTENEKKAYMLAHNKLTLNTGFDNDLLSMELGEIIDIDMGVFEFADGVMGLEELFEKETEEDLPPPPQEPMSAVGQIYLLGRHRLMCGDSTDERCVNRLMDGKLADLLLTDPPYNVGYVGGTSDKLTIENDSMQNPEFREFLRSAFSNAYGCLRPGAAFYVWHPDSNGLLFRDVLSECGLDARQCLVWVKNSLVLGRQDYQWRHEPCLYGWKSGAAHTWESDRSQTTILEFDRPQRSKPHPTMKPIPLFSYLIKNSSKRNEIVLDLFGGSGTSIVAAERHNRTCYMMECDPRYVDVIISRWEAETGGVAKLVASV